MMRAGIAACVGVMLGAISLVLSFGAETPYTWYLVGLSSGLGLSAVVSMMRRMLAGEDDMLASAERTAKVISECVTEELRRRGEMFEAVVTDDGIVVRSREHRQRFHS